MKYVTAHWFEQFIGFNSINLAFINIYQVYREIFSQSFLLHDSSFQAHSLGCTTTAILTSFLITCVELWVHRYNCISKQCLFHWSMKLIYDLTLDFKRWFLKYVDTMCHFHWMHFEKKKHLISLHMVLQMECPMGNLIFNSLTLNFMHKSFK